MLKTPGGLIWHIRSMLPNKQLDYAFPFESSYVRASVGDIDVWGT